MADDSAWPDHPLKDVPTGKLGEVARAAEIAGGQFVGGVGDVANLPINLLKSTVGLPGRGAIRNVLGLPQTPPPSLDWTMGPTPQGGLENVLAAGARTLGQTLPAAVLGGPGVPWATTGDLLQGAAKVPLAAATGASVGEARRQFVPNAPGGAVMDPLLGAATGGVIGGLAGGGAAAIPISSMRAAIGAGVGDASEFVARNILGIPANVAQVLSIPVAMAVGGVRLPFSAAGAAAGGLAGEFEPTQTNPLFPPGP